MTRRIAVLALVGAFAAAPAMAQKKGAAKPVLYDITVTAEGRPYTGTMTLATTAGKVSGEMHITNPGEITGKAAGTSKGRAMKLDFPYRMVERGCDGRIVMDITLPEKKGAESAKGTVDITGCDGGKLAGTVELKLKKG